MGIITRKIYEEHHQLARSLYDKEQIERSHTPSHPVVALWWHYSSCIDAVLLQWCCRHEGHKGDSKVRLLFPGMGCRLRLENTDRARLRINGVGASD